MHDLFDSKESMHYYDLCFFCAPMSPGRLPRQMHTDQCRLLVVCSNDDAVEACREVGKYLEWRRQRLPCSPLIGMWIQSAMPDLPCERLGLEWESDQCVFQFRESIGVNGKWSLWCLDATTVAGITGPKTLRESLLVSLTNDLRDPGPRFAPVFDVEETPESIREETSRIDRQFSMLAMPALICDTDRGSLYPVSAAWRGDG